jgi:hypothetical protein
MMTPIPMAPLNPSEWVLPRVKKGTDPPDPDLHAMDIQILPIRHKMGLGQSQDEGLVSSSPQKVNQVLSKI